MRDLRGSAEVQSLILGLTRDVIPVTYSKLFREVGPDGVNEYDVMLFNCYMYYSS